MFPASPYKAGMKRRSLLATAHIEPLFTLLCLPFTFAVRSGRYNMVFLLIQVVQNCPLVRVHDC
jgi:hypothetical protein